MAEYVYKQSKAEMIEKNLTTANHELQRLNNQIQNLMKEMNWVVKDVEAVSNGWIPNERKMPSTIHGELPSSWFFDPVHICDCHDCPLQSIDHKIDSQFRCGAECCIIRQLCELEGTIQYHTL